jgi:hypothetical protein
MGAGARFFILEQIFRTGIIGERNQVECLPRCSPVLHLFADERRSIRLCNLTRATHADALTLPRSTENSCSESERIFGKVTKTTTDTPVLTFSTPLFIVIFGVPNVLPCSMQTRLIGRARACSYGRHRCTKNFVSTLLFGVFGATERLEYFVHRLKNTPQIDLPFLSMLFHREGDGKTITKNRFRSHRPSRRN